MAASATPVSSSGSPAPTVSPMARAMPGVVGGAGGAVDQRQPVEQRGGPDRADHQVLEPGLQRGGPAHLGGAQHVQGDRQQLEADEQRHQVLRSGQQHHAEDRAQQQREVLAMARLGGRPVAQRQHHCHQPGHVEQQREEQRQDVDGQRALDDGRAVARIPVGDREPAGREQRGHRQQRHQRPLCEPSRRAGRPAAPRRCRRPGRRRARAPGSRSPAPSRHPAARSWCPPPWRRSSSSGVTVRAAGRVGGAARQLLRGLGLGGLRLRRRPRPRLPGRPWPPWSPGALQHQLRVHAKRHDHGVTGAITARSSAPSSAGSAPGPTRLCMECWKTRIM